MKKCNFYSIMRLENGPGAVLQTGYQDNNGIWYYKNNGFWQAISPDNGLMITYGTTRKEAAEKVNTPEMQKRLARFLASESGQWARTRFIEAIKEAEA